MRMLSIAVFAAFCAVSGAAAIPGAAQAGDARPLNSAESIALRERLAAEHEV